MSATSRLALPLLAAGQAQKHVTHNEALGQLDALVHLAVADAAAVDAPPGAAEGTRVLVAASPVGAFTGQAFKVAERCDGAWRFHVPLAGWTALVLPARHMLAFDGAVWRDVTARAADTLGISATASATDRLSVSADGTLLSHAGGSHRLKINKAAVAGTASVVYQTNFSGRAEVGLAGADNLSVKVSPDGSAWTTALTIDRTSGWLGCGNAAPSAPLDVQAAANGYVVALRGGAQVLSYQVWGSIAYLWNFNGDIIAGTNSAHDLRFGTHAQERMRITSAGAIGIGTTSPTTLLDVAGPARVGNYAKAALPSASASGAGAIIHVSDESGGAVLAFSDGAAWRRVTDRAIVS
jgi:hypothetical protein